MVACSRMSKATRRRMIIVSAFALTVLAAVSVIVSWAAGVGVVETLAVVQGVATLVCHRSRIGVCVLQVGVVSGVSTASHNLPRSFSEKTQ